MVNDLKDYFLGADPKKHKDYNYFAGKGKKGWVNESARHSMSAYGIKTGTKNNVQKFSVAGKKGTGYIREGLWVATKEKVAKDKLVFAKLDSVLEDIDEDEVDGKVLNEKLNDAKREIRMNGKLDFVEMDGRTMAYSILSDAQESLPYSKKNAVLFINQAKDLLRGNYKKEDHTVIFPDGESAIF